MLVADDSALMRKLLVDILESDPEIEVVATVKNGMEAVDYAVNHGADVITMDIEMPKMDGFTALQHIMEKLPTPILMLSAMDKRNADTMMKSFDYGAVDFISKPSGTLSLDIEKIGDEIISKIKMASGLDVKRMAVHKAHISPIHTRKTNLGNDWLIAIGASTGGPKALTEILSMLPGNIPASLLIVQHMPAGFTLSFAERLNWHSSLEVKEAVDGDVIRPGQALVAPGDFHLETVANRVELNQNEKVHSVRPSIDVMMRSVSRAPRDKVIGVLLTGMGNDGARGMKAIKENGGITIAQDESSSIVFGMPREAIALKAVDHVVPLDEIAPFIIKIIEGG